MHPIGWFFAGVLLALFVCICIADWRQTRRDRAIHNLQSQLVVCARLFSYLGKRDEMQPVAAELEQASRQAQGWAEAGLTCLARVPGTCPETCKCRGKAVDHA